MENKVDEECPQQVLMDVVATLQDDDERGLERLEGLLKEYAFDPRLHFLRGSILAGKRRYDEAHLAMRRAIEIAPDFALARFQLGFLEMTSGNFAAAEMTWAPLDSLPEDDALRTFAVGLRHFACDDFAKATQVLEEGIARNKDNAPINADMRLIIGKAQELLEAKTSEATSEEPVTSTHLLLQQYAAKTTRH